MQTSSYLLAFRRMQYGWLSLATAGLQISFFDLSALYMQVSSQFAYLLIV